MKLIKRNLWVLMAVLLMLALVAAIQVSAAPKAQDAPPAPEIPFLAEWQGSPHNDAESESFIHWDEEEDKVVPTSCAKCHSTTGYLDFLGADGSEAGVVDEAPAIGTTVSCVACHNAATVAKSSVVFPSGIELTNLGAEARCMECHQGRESKLSVDKQITDTFKLTDADLDTVVEPLIDTTKNTTTTFGFRNVHYFAAAATQYGTLVKGGYEYEGMSYDGKFEHPAPYDTCVGCHDSHKLELKIEECATCHEGVASVEDFADIRMAGSLMDYDGDGDAEEGVGTELAGLQEKLIAAIQAYAKEVAGADIGYDAATYPYWFGDANANGTLDEGERAYASWTPRLLKAAYNYQVATKDPGQFAHNAKYIIQLQHDSIADLNTKLAEPVDIENAARNDVGHFDGSSEAFRHWDEEGMVAYDCAKCHSATGLPEFLENGGTVAVDGRGTVRTTGVGEVMASNGLACTTCHDHTAFPAVYAITSVPFPSGKSVSFSTEEDDEGNLVPVADNLCLQCHQGRQSTATMNIALKDKEDDTVPDPKLRFQNVHYFAAGASLFGTEAQGAYEYADKEYLGRNAHMAGFDTCTGCHDAHKLELELDKCTTCHAGAASAAEIRFGTVDYDGDDDTEEGIAAEIAALEEMLLTTMQAYAKDVVEAPIAYSSSAYPYYFADADGSGTADEGETSYTDWTPRLLRAAYNYQFVQKDPGMYAHNPKYAVQILYDSLEDLGLGGVEVDLTALTRPEVED